MDQMNSGRLSEVIALQIAELILSGEIKNGTKLRQEELAGMLQVSRIPVREALQLLETQGLAKRLATRHIITAELTDVHIRQTYEMIADIEYRAMKTIDMENGPVPGGNMAGHRIIIDKTQNLYIQTLLMNALTYYVGYAEKILQAQQGKDGAMCDIFSGERSDVEKKEMLTEHYRALSEAVIMERRKHDDIA